MIIYKINFYENWHIYFFIKEEKVFIRYIDILQKVSNIIKSNFIANLYIAKNRSRCSEVFLEKGVLKICTKFTGEHACRSAISIKLLSNFIEITVQHGCSPVNFLHIFRTPFLRNTYE